MGGYSGMMNGMVGGGYAGMTGWLPDLTPEQARKIGPLQNELVKSDLAVMRQRGEVQASLNNLYLAEKRDWNAIRAASQTLFDLQRKQMNASIDLQQKIDTLLTDNQRRELARAWSSHEWMGEQWHEREETK